MQTLADNVPVQPKTRSMPFGGLGFLLATLLTVVLLAHHPVATKSTSQAVTLDLIIQLGARDEIVHGLLIGAFGLLLYGVTELSLLLDARRPQVAAGLLAYVLGCASVIGAMLLDGFVTPQAALHISQAGGTLQDASASFAVLSTCIQVLTKAGLCAMGAGMLLWSPACWNHRSGRALAVCGILAGFVPSVAVVMAGVRLQPHLLILLAAGHGLWNLSAAYLLWKEA
jgi:hypothetical protein